MVFMYTRNKALLHEAPSHTPRRTGEPLGDLDAFIEDIQTFIDEDQREQFSKDMQRHLGVKSTYKVKDSVLQGLNIIRERWHDPVTEDSEKAMIAAKLKERSEECTQGFHNGVNEVLEGFYVADSIEDLLYRVRQDIVTRLTPTLTSETHNYNRIFAVAERMGFGVQALNSDDSYVDVWEEILPTSKIEAALQPAFEKGLGIFPVLQGLEEQLRGQLTTLGYSGTKEEGYDSDIVDKVLDYFSRLYGDIPEVGTYKEKKTALDDKRKQAADAKSQAEDKIESVLKDNGIDLTKYKSHKIKALLGDKSVLNLPFIKTFLSDIPPDVTQKISEIKKVYLTEISEINVAEARQKYLDDYAAVKSIFLVGNEVTQELNWPRIKQLLWEKVKAKGYYEFSPDEIACIDALMNPDGAEVDVDVLKGLISSIREYVSALQNVSKEIQQELNLDARALIADAKDFNEAMSILDANAKRDLLESIFPELPGLIHSDRDFNLILRGLSPAEVERFLDENKGLLINLIQNDETASFFDAIYGLPTNIQIALLGEFKDDVRLLLQGSDDAVRIRDFSLEFQKASVDMLLLPTNIDQLNEREILGIFQSFDPQLHADIFQVLRGKWPDLITSSGDFNFILKHLSPELQGSFFEACKPFLPDVIKSGPDFGEAAQYLSPDLHGEFLEACKPFLPDVIGSGFGFGAAVRYLSPELQGKFIEACKPFLPANAGDFGYAVKKLSPEVQVAFIEACKPHLPSILMLDIKSGLDFTIAVRHLSPEAQGVFIEACKPFLPDVIQSGLDFTIAVRHLSPDLHGEFLEACKPFLPDVIQSGYDFGRAFRDLSSEVQGEFLEACKPFLPDVIKSGIDFSDAADLLSPELQGSFFEACKPFLPDVIQSGYDFGRAFRDLSSEVQGSFLEACKPFLPDVIKSGIDFSDAVEYLSPELQGSFFEACKPFLPDVIKIGYDFGRAFRGLSSEVQGEFLEACKPFLPDVIKSGMDFSDAADLLSPEVQGVFIEACWSFLPDFIIFGFDIGNVAHYLSAELQREVLDIIKDQLPIVRGEQELKSILKELKDEVRPQFIALAKDSIADLIIRDSAPSNESMLAYLQYNLKQTMLLSYELATGFFGAMHPTDEEDNTVYYLPGIDQAKLIDVIQAYSEVLSDEETQEVLEALKEKLPEGFELESLTDMHVNYKAEMQRLRGEEEGPEQEQDVEPPTM